MTRDGDACPSLYPDTFPSYQGSHHQLAMDKKKQLTLFSD